MESSLHAILGYCTDPAEGRPTELGWLVDKLIIEVRVNEYAMRDGNPNVPWTPDEIAQDAAEIRAAGASILHFHARQPDGSPAHDYDTYAATIRGIRQAGDLLVHSTLGQITVQGDAARIAHILRLAEDPALKPEFASMDIGSTNIDVYDPVAKRFATTNKSYVNATETLLFFARTFRDAGIKPAIACWAVPFLRYAEALLDMELLAEPAYLLLVHTDRSILGGHPPTPAGLRAFLDFLPRNKRVHWTVNAKPGNLFPLAAQAIQLGGHVAIGIGDNPYAELGAPRNAELVRRVVELAKACGREIATPDEARVMLGIPR
jgi:3-keto-5-aminohexanoate cleavage enzyme